MELRCKVFRAEKAAELEQAINRFLGEELPDGEVQLEEITQSGGPEGVTVVVWYSIAEPAYDDLDVEIHHALGAPATEICRAADELDADLIVLGTHGRTGLRHAILGSVAEKVVRHSKRPVLTIHPGEHPLEATK